MFGIGHEAVVYLVEQLQGARHCRHYTFRHQQYEPPEEDEVCVWSMREIVNKREGGCVWGSGKRVVGGSVSGRWTLDLMHTCVEVQVNVRENMQNEDQKISVSKRF